MKKVLGTTIPGTFHIPQTAGFEQAEKHAKNLDFMVLEVFRDKFHDKFYSMTISFIYSAAKLSISCCLSAIAC